MDAAAQAADLDGLVSRARLHPARLDGLQRRHDGVPAGAGFADPSGGAGRVAGVDAHLQQGLGRVLRPGIPGVRPAVRAPVQPRLDRFPRHPGPVHARAWHRLLPQQPPRHAGAARVRHRQSDEVERVRRERVGPDRQRRSAEHHPGLPRRAAPVLPLPHPRRRPVRGLRRRHHRADRGGVLDRVRAGGGDSGDPGNAQALRRLPVFELRFPGFVQPQLQLRYPAQDRPHDPQPRLGRQRLHRHRPRRDRHHDRQLPQRVRLERDEEEQVHPHRTGARRLHRRLADPGRRDPAAAQEGRAGGQCACAGHRRVARRRRRGAVHPPQRQPQQPE